MSTRITDEVAGWINEALDTRPDERGTKFDVSLTVMPGPGGQPMPAFVVTIVVKHNVLGQTLTGQAAIPTITPTQEQVQGLVNQTLNELQQARSKDTADFNGQGSGDKPLRLS